MATARRQVLGRDGCEGVVPDAVEIAARTLWDHDTRNLQRTGFGWAWGDIDDMARDDYRARLAGGGVATTREGKR